MRIIECALSIKSGEAAAQRGCQESYAREEETSKGRRAKEPKMIKYKTREKQNGIMSC